MQDPNDHKLDRRSFLNQAAGVVAGSAFASSALSYDRIVGANERIALGHIGIGNRGNGLHMMASRLKDTHKVETVAVTIVAGPLNYVGVNPKVTCAVPQPSK